MRIHFYGANRMVTGSCHFVEVNGLRVFLDMGMAQGPREEARRFNEWLPEEFKSADAMILSHGHFDHCGKIPVFTRAGFDKPIYCTPATVEVARIILEDAAEIQVEDAEYLNRRERSADEPQVRPLYVPSDIPRVMKLMKRTPYRQKMDLGRGVSFTFYDAGHILGSAYVVLEWMEKSSGRRKTLLFTGDIGRYNAPIIQDPEPLPHAIDYVITESTYGGKVHAPISEVGPQLLECVKFCVEKRSRLLVPAFAVGRTQTILWYMQRFIAEGAIPKIPIYVDSPMASDASEVHSDFRENYDQETRRHIGELDLFGQSPVIFARTSQESRRINSDNGPCVIVASSPTCEFGRILHHLKVSVERQNDMVVMTGWVPSNTLGRRLQEGQPRLRIYDRWYERKCQVRTIHGLSAHADGEELMKFLTPTLRPETTAYVVHGEADQAEAMARNLAARGVGQVVVPALESSVMAGEVEPAEHTAATSAMVE